MLPKEISGIILLNPVAQIIEMSHNVVLYDLLPSLQDLLYTGIVSLVIFFTGLVIFQKRVGTIIDDI